MSKRNIRCIVASVNSNGEPDLYFVKVFATEKQISNGEHYDAAKASANRHGYDPVLAYDEDGPAGDAMTSLFMWESASTVDISP